MHKYIENVFIRCFLNKERISIKSIVLLDVFDFFFKFDLHELREFTTSVKHGEIKLLMLISNSSEFFSCAFLLLLYIVVKPQRIKIAFACTR